MSSVSFKVASRSTQSIAQSADALRSSLRFTQPKFPLLTVVEEILPQFMEDFSFEVKESYEMGDAHGLTLPDRQELWLREDVYEGVRRDKGRDRFTLAHELGHLLLHDEPGLARVPHPPRTLRAFEDSEWQANTFASLLLIPRAVVAATPEVLSVASICAVTTEAAIVRLKIYREKGI